MNETSFAQVLSWFDNYYSQVIENKKRIRGKTFSGCRIEIHDINHVNIVHELGVEGDDPETKVGSLIKNVMYDNRNLILEYPMIDFLKIVRGEKTVQETDYFWNDEE